MHLERGQQVEIVRGPHDGLSGRVIETMLDTLGQMVCVQASWGEMFWVEADDVKIVESSRSCG